MYGKLMSVSDELMWKYWVFLTDLRLSEVESLKADVAAGRLHPMEAKSGWRGRLWQGSTERLLRASADENWARMFQQKETAEDLEEVKVEFTDIDAHSAGLIRLPKLLVLLGLASSNAEANARSRKGPSS